MDRRAKLIKITPKGCSLLPSAQEEIANAQERTVAPLTLRERAELMRLLHKNNLLSRALHRAPRFAA